MAALSVHLHGTAEPTAGQSPAALLAPMLIGPLAFLLLAGVVVMFDPLIVMGKPSVVAVEQRPGIPAHTHTAHNPQRMRLRARRTVEHRGPRTPQNR
jgi:hypothetical protein